MRKKVKLVDSLGDRMKGYENISRIYLTKRMPVIIRIDGRAFHSFTRGFDKPFDKIFNEVMYTTAYQLCKEISGCKLAYVQSDEISLLLIDYENIETQPWFDNNLQKLVSISASLATLAFMKEFRKYENVDIYERAAQRGATFDARAFVLPKEEVTNYFIWRQQDATRNSIQMYAQSLFSHRELQGKSSPMLQEMLFSKGINWNNVPIICKRGVCIKKVHSFTEDNLIWIIDKAIPIFTQDRQYIEELI